MSIVNVRCTGNNSSATNGNDIFYKFNLTRNSNGLIVNPLQVDISDSDFGVTGQLKYVNTATNPGLASIGSFSGGVLNLSTSELNDLNPSDQSISFQLTVDANSTDESGNFVVKVSNRNINDASCCRMAVSEEFAEDLNGVSATHERIIKVVPNPGQNHVFVQTKGEWAEYRIVDVQGRIVLFGNGFKNSLSLPTEKLSNGLYRVIISNQNETQSANFQIIK